VFIPLIFGTFIVGIWPEIFSKFYHLNINSLIEFLYF
jgi:hypothetical protein